MLTIGIDPGLSGAIAALFDDGHVVVHDMPTMQTGEGAVKNSIDGYALANLLRPWAEFTELGGQVAVFLERVTAMPSIPGKGGARRPLGAASSFSLGGSYWGAFCVCAALRLPIHLVDPRTWKAHFKLGKDKDLARGLAIRYYPSADLSRKKDHGRAEALLIARYGREKK